jgi:hypothetical protein
MKTGSMAVRAQSGAVSAALLGLTGLIGFAAGAMLAGLLLAGGDTTPAPAASDRAAASNAAPRGPAPTLAAPATDWPAAQAPSPWPFESGRSAAADVPGRNRPDRLGGPEGWTPEPDYAGP